MYVYIKSPPCTLQIYVNKAEKKRNSNQYEKLNMIIIYNRLGESQRKKMSSKSKLQKNTSGISLYL